MIAGFTFIELPVDNLQQSMPFYQDTLGLQISLIDEVRHWCLFQIPGSTTGCALYESAERYTSGTPNQSIHIVVRVENIEKLMLALSAEGIETEPVRLHDDEHFRITGFTDPNGHIWRIWEPLADS